MIAALALMQVAAESARAWEADAFKPYSECVMAAAKELALSDASNTQVEDRALDACNHSKTIAQLQIQAHYQLESYRSDDDLFTAAFERLTEADQKKLVRAVSNSKFDELDVGLRAQVRKAFLTGRNR